ncbi:MAG: PrsW family intramembrane metalloprotease [Anaerolineae bacterium]|nr:PrsW family intramembrane metalloprotease [Anaerolineae bacterium]
MSETAVLIISILAATLPVLVYISLIYWVDRYEKEPGWLLTATFLWGAVPSVIIAYVANSVLGMPFYLLTSAATADTLVASFIAPIVEESIKGAAVLGIFLFWKDEIDSPLDGIIYGAMVGLGFALVENVIYYVAQYQAGGLEAWGWNVFFRGLVFGLNHALYTGMTGLGIATALMSTNPLVKIGAPIAGWATAVLLHTIHNLTVSFGNLICLIGVFSDWGGIFLTLVIMLWALLQERSWLKRYLAGEVAFGTLTLSQFEIACSGRKRIRQRWHALARGGYPAYRHTLHYHNLLSELAYKKHHFDLFKHEATWKRVELLREQIRLETHQVL